jgi:DNA-binding NarL/FixJ family response regulator
MVRRTQVAILAEAGLFRQALCSRLAKEDELQVASTAATIHDLVLRAGGRPVDVLLACLSIPAGLAAEVFFDIRLLLPATRIVVLGGARDERQAVRWFEAGVFAWLGPEASYQRLREAIVAVAQGRAFCPAEMIPDVALRIARLERETQHAGVCAEEPLTDRESEVVQLVRLGLSTKAMARHLGLRPATVKSHVSRVLRKLGAARRGDLDLRRSGGGRNVEEG